MSNACQWPVCKSFAPEGKRFCFLHGRNEIKEKSAPKPIAKKSEKFKVEHKEYIKIVKEMLKDNNRCELCVVGVCVGTASGLHHKKRRGKNLLNKDYLMRACNPCNTYLEQFPVYAKENGLSLSKFN